MRLGAQGWQRPAVLQAGGGLHQGLFGGASRVMQPWPLESPISEPRTGPCGSTPAPPFLGLSMLLGPACLGGQHRPACHSPGGCGPAPVCLSLGVGVAACGWDGGHCSLGLDSSPLPGFLSVPWTARGEQVTVSQRAPVKWAAPSTSAWIPLALRTKPKVAHGVRSCPCLWALSSLVPQGRPHTAPPGGSHPTPCSPVLQGIPASARPCWGSSSCLPGCLLSDHTVG